MIEQTAKVIHPTQMVSEMLVSSSVPETDYAAWSAATAYTLGQKCIRTATHRIYERLIAGTTASSPEIDSVNWLDIGPTNRWAMFDDVVGTSTTATSSLAVSFKPGAIAGIALLEVLGDLVTVSIKDNTGGSVVYSKSISIDGSDVLSIYDWFFNPLIRDANVVFADIPFHFEACEVTVSLSGVGAISIGVCKVGEVIGIGKCEANASSGIIDYSIKTVDSFGRYSIAKRDYSKRMSIKILTNKEDYNRISRALSKLRATPAVWIATDSAGYDPLTIYGFYKDFSIDVAYLDINYCSLEIEGLI